LLIAGAIFAMGAAAPAPARILRVLAAGLALGAATARPAALSRFAAATECGATAASGPRLWIRRLKNGLAVEHPIAGDELRAIKRYLATRTDSLPWLFVSEREQPLTRQSVNYLIAMAARRAALPPVHPHMLRHSCGFYLANRGYDLRLIQDYLGHRDPKHTVLYTRVAGSRFEGLWR
jgi:Phage integrase family